MQMLGSLSVNIARITVRIRSSVSLNIFIGGPVFNTFFNSVIKNSTITVKVKTMYSLE